MRNSQPFQFYCQPTDQFPNSPLPVLLYQAVLASVIFFRLIRLRKHLRRNGWSNAHVGGIHTQLHYHSNNHVVFVILRGWTDIVVGGYRGHRFRIEKGDVLIIPAGVAFKNLGRQHDIVALTAWPEGTKGDLNTGIPGERPAADIRISAVPMPAADPVFGHEGDLLPIWYPVHSWHHRSALADRNLSGERHN